MKKNNLINLFILLFLLCGCSKKYSVKIVDDKGKLLSSYSIESGSIIKDIEPPKKDGYIFVAYKRDGKKFDIKTPIYEDTVLEPTFTKIPKVNIFYKVMFNFGNYEKSQNVKYNDKVKKPDDPYLDGYKFLGWYENGKLYDFNMPTEKDIVLVAKYEKTRFCVNFDLDGGIGTKEIVIESGEKIPIPKEPEKLGYHFMGWYLDDKLFNFNTIIQNDILLRAKWIVADYVKVTFDTDGGDLIKSQIIEKDSNLLNLPVPKKNGYKFDYWSYLNQEFNSDMKIENDITLKAIYKKE